MNIIALYDELGAYRGHVQVTASQMNERHMQFRLFGELYVSEYFGVNHDMAVEVEVLSLRHIDVHTMHVKPRDDNQFGNLSIAIIDLSDIEKAKRVKEITLI